MGTPDFREDDEVRYWSDTYGRYLRCRVAAVFRTPSGALHGYRVEGGELERGRTVHPSKVEPLA